VTGRVEIFRSLEALSGRAAALVARTVGEARWARGVARIALSGGRTPRRTYEILGARGELADPAVEIFFCDERCVPPTDERSNYRLVAATIGDAGNVRRIRGEDEPDAAAEAYEALLRERFGAGPPAFDLVLLGLGADGHTASLFPGAPEVAERRRWVVATREAHGGVRRVTLTLPVLDAARTKVLLAAGAAKAPAVADVLAGGASPAARLRGLRMLLDEAAAGRVRAPR
jgi:6-phosphogluconolactonase